jgi:hypothetical protein
LRSETACQFAQNAKFTKEIRQKEKKAASFSLSKKRTAQIGVSRKIKKRAFVFEFFKVSEKAFTRFSEHPPYMGGVFFERRFYG